MTAADTFRVVLAMVGVIMAAGAGVILESSGFAMIGGQVGQLAYPTLEFTVAFSLLVIAVAIVNIGQEVGNQ